LISLFLFLDRA